MALNEIYVDANELSLPVAEATVSGDLVQVGELVGVALVDAKEGEDGEFYATVKLSGAFKFGHTLPAAPEVGAKLYYDGSLNTQGSGKFIGHVLKATGADVVVRLVQN